ncbi:hypothetical protein BU23DRAFT_510659 [Bimuria novae-zelandiae CBS 107.79]|uniref:Uncharacterized protein n=1 Tax=Bimuria novae-zelandiae CBS 107.79 TaxID=1447943 RepID=A0A6A5V4J9_9PLEO|nr:hypothetical protein BU23DRAFT_510659 [Bimuria novae-zelandiae CBS 107.79]
MGIPYSREINAAFEQVTPLVAAGFKVLQTMKDISILLAVIQVLTVLFLAMILFVLILLLYSVNPDLEYERRHIITPLLKYLASLTLWAVFKGTVTPIAGVSIALGVTWWVFRLEYEETYEMERTADEDADEALESISGEGDKDKKKKSKSKKGKKGKGKGNELEEAE